MKQKEINNERYSQEEIDAIIDEIIEKEPVKEIKEHLIKYEKECREINLMTSPKVIFNCKFTHAFNRREENYTAKQIEGLKKKIARKFDYFSNEDKRVMNLFDYYTGELNKNDKMNLVIENGSYATKEEIEKRKKQFVKYAENSNLWQFPLFFVKLQII